MRHPSPGDTSIRIRLADSGDRADLARLHRLAHTVSFSTFADPDWARGRNRSTYLEYWSSYFRERSARDRTWIATAGRRAVGTVTIRDLSSCGEWFRPSRTSACPDGPVGCLRLMYVHPGECRRRIGRSLMVRARRYMEQRGDVLATLITHAANRPARAFYEAQGWALDTLFERQVADFFTEPTSMRRRARYRLQILDPAQTVENHFREPRRSADTEAALEVGHGLP